MPSYIKLSNTPDGPQVKPGRRYFMDAKEPKERNDKKNKNQVFDHFYFWKNMQIFRNKVVVNITKIQELRWSSCFEIIKIWTISKRRVVIKRRLFPKKMIKRVRILIKKDRVLLFFLNFHEIWREKKVQFFRFFSHEFLDIKNKHDKNSRAKIVRSEGSKNVEPETSSHSREQAFDINFFGSPKSADGKRGGFVSNKKNEVPSLSKNIGQKSSKKDQEKGKTDENFCEKLIKNSEKVAIFKEEVQKEPAGIRVPYHGGLGV